MAAPVVDVGRLLDDGRGSGYQRWLVALTALTIVFDGIDNQLMGVAIPTLMREWSVPRGAFAPVVSLGYLGMMAGSAGIAASPASVAPSGTHTIVTVTASGRCRSGTYSPESAAALGMAPPRPSPARKRRAPSAATPSAAATAMVITPKTNRHPSSAVRRP